MGRRVTFSQRVELLPDWVLERIFVSYRAKPFSHKNRTILRAVSQEQGNRATSRHREILELDLLHFER